MLKTEQIGFDLLTELSDEVRNSFNGRTGVVHTRNTINEETLMQLPYGIGTELENGHSLAIDTKGNMALADNPTAEIRASKTVTPLLQRDSETIAMRRLLRGWGLDDSVLLSKRIPTEVNGLLPLMLPRESFDKPTATAAPIQEMKLGSV